MTSLLVLVAAAAPVIGTAAVAAIRPGGAGVARAAVRSSAVGAVAAAAVVVLTLLADDGVPDGLATASDWVVLGVDRAGALLLLAVVATALVVAAFSERSLDAAHHRTSGYFVAITAVASGSALVVLPGGPLPLLAGWLLAGRALVHVTGGWVDSPVARRAHRRLRTTTLVGDGALVAAVAVAVAVAGAGAIAGRPDAVAELATSRRFGVDADVVVAGLLLVAGAARSGLVPFHRWLTGTLFAPTPVSALVHAGFVSGAGLLMIRFAPLVAGAPAVLVTAAVLATVTIVVGTGASLMRSDAKGSLAWSTIAQMAFMVLQCAVGAFAGAVFHIVGHGMYKAAMFLGAGDTVAARLRARRRPVRTEPLGRWARLAGAAIVGSIAVAAGLAVGPVGLGVGEQVVLIAFAWTAATAGAHGMLGSRSIGRGVAASMATVTAAATAAAYFGGLRVVKHALEPSFAGVDVDPDVAAITAVAAVSALAAIAISLAIPGTVGRRWRAIVRHRIEAVTAVRRVLDLGEVGATAGDRRDDVGPATIRVDADRIETATLRAQVARAAEIIAPSWPLASFVAVNPLGGLEHRSFDDATAEARRWMHARTHRRLADFRADHARGMTNGDDLVFVVHDVAMVACGQPPVHAPGRSVDAVEVVLADLLHGPEPVDEHVPRTELERRFGVGAGARLGIDELVAEWALAHVAPPAWQRSSTGRTFVAGARASALVHARRRLGPDAVAWLSRLTDDPAQVLAASLVVAEVRPTDRVDEIRGHLVQLPGWAGFSRWRTEWAQPDEPTPMLRPIDLAAARAMLEAATLIAVGGGHADRGRHEPGPAGASLLDDRVAATITHLDLPDDAATRSAVAGVLALVPDAMRSTIWLRAQERHLEQDLLGALADASPSHGPTTPDAQIVLCIDVRSEGLRRHIEAQGRDATIGFAGFFGVPMSVRELGWPESEPRCPVLVSPSAAAVEQPLVDHIGDAAQQLWRTGVAGALTGAHAATKYVPGAAFAAAETFGWAAGPRAAWRTLGRSRAARHAPAPRSTVRIGTEVGVEQRVFTAESVLRTMGLVDGFAELVVLCGHTSATVNNAHGTALECGACAGASGAANARAVAALLNESDVRTGLIERGIEIPDGTWFVGAVHDTASDTVTILDRHVAPASHTHAIEAFQQRLDRAGTLQAADRAGVLPGARDAADVRRRGADWAQVRPEWGLAGNAAFVIAPRSSTAGVDLGGRAFLHTYDAGDDPDGRVLEAIMTAPLVVGHWISSQYYFSTVDPEAFGAGDKLLHNPVGAVGVLTGAGGDLRIGLPTQSTHVADVAHHQPLRLLAVVEADLAVVESIIGRNDVVRRLVDGGWLRIAVRSGAGAPWSTRSPGGTWSELPTRAASRSPRDVADCGDRS